MIILSNHFKDVERNAGFSADAIAVLEAAARQIDENEELSRKFSALVQGYMTEKPVDLGKEFLPKVEALETYGIHKYTLDLIYIMACSEILHQRYIDKSIPEELFWLFTVDFRCKMTECIETEGVVGTFVADWNDLFFTMDRFCLGRFQYEYDKFPADYVTKTGYKIKEGTPCLNMHIPSMGIPLRDDVRLDSYKQAYEFFKNIRTDDGCLIVRCNSWLLFPRHPEFLPDGSNILKFFGDFEIMEGFERENFNDDWRIWNKYSDLPLEERPADTKLRKAYKDWMMSGNKTGYGRGVFVFDGEKII